MKKKVIVVGGGVAGLSAGIYGVQNGYDVEIYEKHTITGGQCTGWKRNGYLIDNCVHWLTGTGRENPLYKIWENVGVLGENVHVLQPKSFYSIEVNGQRLTLWRDLDRTEKELLQISPEDEKEIKKFIQYTRFAQSLVFPTEKPMDMMNFIEMIKLGASMADMSKVMKEYGKISIKEFALRFKHPLLQYMVKYYMPGEYLAYCLIVSYATFTSGNGGIPQEGSLAMAMRMQKRFKDLGGKVFTGKGVTKIDIRSGKAVGIYLEDGSFKAADYIICACDTSHTFEQLLDPKYMDKKMRATYQEAQNNPVFSAFQAAFAVSDTFDAVPDALLFDCEPLTVATQTVDCMGVKNYRSYGTSIAPEGKTVIQCHFLQYEEDYRYWKQLYANQEAYLEKKEELAGELRKRIEVKFPEYHGKLELLDTWTPITYNRYCNAYYGAYMSFATTNNSRYTSFTGQVKGLQNVVLASQWLMSPGGLPTAVVMGKFAIQRIMKNEKK